MLKAIDEAIEYHEERIQDVYDRYNSKSEKKRGKQWKKEMRHRQRQHRAALESIYLTLEQVLAGLPTAGPNGRLRQEIIGYMKRLQPHADNKSKGDSMRLLGSSKQYASGDRTRLQESPRQYADRPVDQYSRSEIPASP